MATKAGVLLSRQKLINALNDPKDPIFIKTMSLMKENAIAHNIVINRLIKLFIEQRIRAEAREKDNLMAQRILSHAKEETRFREEAIMQQQKVVLAQANLRKTEIEVAPRTPAIVFVEETLKVQIKELEKEISKSENKIKELVNEIKEINKREMKLFEEEIYKMEIICYHDNHQTIMTDAEKAEKIEAFKEVMAEQDDDKLIRIISESIVEKNAAESGYIPPPPPPPDMPLLPPGKEAIAAAILLAKNIDRPSGTALANHSELNLIMKVLFREFSDIEDNKIYGADILRQVKKDNDFLKARSQLTQALREEKASKYDEVVNEAIKAGQMKRNVHDMQQALKDPKKLKEICSSWIPEGEKEAAAKALEANQKQPVEEEPTPRYRR